jgi:hypothetical protein
VFKKAFCSLPFRSKKVLEADLYIQALLSQNIKVKKYKPLLIWDKNNRTCQKLVLHNQPLTDPYF